MSSTTKFLWCYEGSVALSKYTSLLYEKGFKLGSTLSQIHTILVKSKPYKYVELNFWYNKKKITENNGVHFFRCLFEDNTLYVFRKSSLCKGSAMTAAADRRPLPTRHDVGCRPTHMSLL